MAKKYNQLRAQLSPAAQQLAAKRKLELLDELPLQELRQARSLSQADLAEILNVRQSSISKIERQTDMYLSTLRRFIGAMGGTLDLVATFPDGKIKISQIHEIETTPVQNSAMVQESGGDYESSQQD
jgi:DNA-binding XRE family transcriptional regulator